MFTFILLLVAIAMFGFSAIIAALLIDIIVAVLIICLGVKLIKKVLKW